MTDVDLEALKDIGHAVTGPTVAVNVDTYRAIIVALERGRRIEGALRVHWLAGIECDHDRGADRPSCACSLVDLGWHPSVGAAVNAWIAHVLSAALAPAPAEGGA